MPVPGVGLARAAYEEKARRRREQQADPYSALGMVPPETPIERAAATFAGVKEQLGFDPTEPSKAVEPLDEATEVQKRGSTIFDLGESVVESERLTREDVGGKRIWRAPGGSISMAGVPTKRTAFDPDAPQNQGIRYHIPGQADVSFPPPGIRTAPEAARPPAAGIASYAETPIPRYEQERSLGDWQRYNQQLIGQDRIRAAAEAAEMAKLEAEAQDPRGIKAAAQIAAMEREAELGGQLTLEQFKSDLQEGRYGRTGEQYGTAIEKLMGDYQRDLRVMRGSAEYQEADPIAQEQLEEDVFQAYEALARHAFTSLFRKEPAGLGELLPRTPAPQQS